MMLFKIDRRNNAVMHAQAAKLTTYCKKLSEEEFRFVVMVMDYHSPLKQYPKGERLKKAKRMIWGKDTVTPELEKHVIASMEEYGELQYDPIRETIIKYNEKIEQLSLELLNDTKAGFVAKIDADIATLQGRVKEMHDDVSRLEESVKLKGKEDSLSMIEQWQANKIKAKRDRKKLEAFKKTHGVHTEN